MEIGVDFSSGWVTPNALFFIISIDFNVTIIIEMRVKKKQTSVRNVEELWNYVPKPFDCNHHCQERLNQKALHTYFLSVFPHFMNVGELHVPNFAYRRICQTGNIPPH